MYLRVESIGDRHTKERKKRERREAGGRDQMPCLSVKLVHDTILNAGITKMVKTHSLLSRSQSSPGEQISKDVIIVYIIKHYEIKWTNIHKVLDICLEMLKIVTSHCGL